MEEKKMTTHGPWDLRRLNEYIEHGHNREYLNIFKRKPYKPVLIERQEE